MSYKHLVKEGSTIGWKEDTTEEDYILTYESPVKIGWKQGSEERLTLIKENESVGWRNTTPKVVHPEIEYRINGGNWVRAKVDHIANTPGNPLNGQYAVRLEYTFPSLSLYGLKNRSVSIINVGDSLEVRPVTGSFNTVGRWADGGGGGTAGWEHSLPSGDKYIIQSGEYALSYYYGFRITYDGDIDQIWFGLGLP